jgi:hypothetical protein
METCAELEPMRQNAESMRPGSIELGIEDASSDSYIKISLVLVIDAALNSL